MCQGGGGGEVTRAGDLIGPRQPQHGCLRMARTLQACDGVGERAVQAGQRHRAVEISSNEPLPHDEAGGQPAGLGDLGGQAQLAVALEVRHRLFGGIEQFGQDEGSLVVAALRVEALEGGAVELA